MSPDHASGVRNGKLLALCFSLALIGAVLSPLPQNWRKNPKDNFPLSYYPMFSTKRDPIETFHYVVGVDEAGHRHFIRHTVIGDGGGNQVRRQLRKIIRAGRAPELAQEVAARVADKTGRRYRDLVSISVCTGKYSVNDWFHGMKQPVSERVSGFAEVKRTQTP
jgi:hypothetical protein